MDVNDFSQIFFSEAEELLADMEQHLLQLDLASPDKEQLNAIFRAAHSLKGGAGTFGFSALQQTTHLLENLLDEARSGKLMLNRNHINLFLESKDIMQAQLEAYQSSQEPDEASFHYICQALREIALLEQGEPVTPPAAAVVAASPVPAQSGDESLLRVTLSAVEPREQTLLREELQHLGTIMQVESLGNSMTVDLLTSVTAEEISAVLCFVLDDTQILIESTAAAEVSAPAPVIAPPPVVAEKPAPAVAAAAPRAANQESSSIRVAVSKVDQIINQVGELIITQAMLSQLTNSLEPGSYDRLQNCVAQMERNTRELQESVMSIRMMPMDYVFSRFPRLVHDLGSRLNKQVELTLKGGSAELDKSLIERIIDPLTHLVRNSLDHGIESPEERLAKGKPACGNLTLSAEHHGGNIVIKVTDDGAGLNREKILAKARSQGMNVSETISDDDVWMLIFAAGFSTAESVTDVSGRGVGMDVVRRNILAMGGHVDIHSRTGEGSTISIFLPLTLAILDGMLVKVADEIYVLPLGAVMESLQPKEEMICRFVGEERLLQVRGEYLPLVLLRQRFAVNGDAHSDDGIVVIVQSAGVRYALWVDQLLGQQQVVVKNLEQNYRKVKGVSAATILGDGSVALILDVVELSTLND
ncbi:MULTISPECIES: chemotaxis protein CheA [Pantoea]|uniref:Chemotaxis protein CheA n=1 Tax=Candidatus Pantoea floridensis TaxID=1938870 RepID=A0A286BXW6_9GAMM|nr:chemotaxis protein CheA [Pantoea floridensis]PIF21472.1 CheA signal transduction histidine kinase [Enterobacteriaceae bacterium JKS000233]SOD38984.1 CheA signal transduction histidine kinase [Pantoea floridensis]